MITLRMNDRYIRGKATFESSGETAKLSYFYQNGLLPLRINSQYEIAGQKWRVAAVNKSEYNSVVINVDLELI